MSGVHVTWACVYAPASLDAILVSLIVEEEGKKPSHYRFIINKMTAMKIQERVCTGRLLRFNDCQRKTSLEMIAKARVLLAAKKSNGFSTAAKDQNFLIKQNC